MDPRPRIALLSLLAAVAIAALPVAPSGAAYPGRPGPIVYNKFKDVLVPEGEILAIHQVGGIYAHGPRRQEPPRALTSDAADSSPVVSPNGRLIAFTSTRGQTGLRRTSQLYLVRRDGSGLRQITSGPTGAGGPYFSRDGRRLVFTRGDGERGFSHLFELTIASGAVRQLTFGHFEDGAPVFTPDGRRIVFTSNRGEDGPRDSSDIWTIGVRGGKARVLVDGPGPEYAPEVSPSGRRIAYVAGQMTRYGFGELRIARSDGRFVRSLDDKRGPECRPCYGSPGWAPDGKHLVAVELSGNVGGTSLMVMRPDGTHRRQFDAGITEVEGVGSHLSAPSWGPAPSR